MGSVSHGTYIPPSDPDAIDDVDLMAVVVPPRRYMYGLHEFEHWVWKERELDVTAYALHKFVRLLLKSNPNVLGLLWLLPDLYVFSTRVFRKFVQSREIFSSKVAYDAFVGYAKAQVEKMERLAFRGYMGKKRKELVDRFGYDCKNAAHAVRLFRMGTEFLETGKLNVYRTADQDELIAIKTGAWSLQRVKEHVDALAERAAQAREKSRLPEKPDHAAAEKLLMWAVERVWAQVDHGIASAPPRVPARGRLSLPGK